MKSQKITPEILKALRDWKNKKCLSYEDIGNLVGLKKASISQWFNKVSNAIRPSSWSKLYPHIAEYLPEDFQPGEILQIEPPVYNEPLTVDLLEQWKTLTRSEKLEILKTIEKINEQKNQYNKTVNL